MGYPVRFGLSDIYRSIEFQFYGVSTVDWKPELDIMIVVRLQDGIL